jgi:nucleolar protein 56
MAPATHVLFESASGYALFEAKLVEEIGAKVRQRVYIIHLRLSDTNFHEQEKDVHKSIQDLHKFGKMAHLKSFVPFKNAAHALENANDVSEGDAPRISICPVI